MKKFAFTVALGLCFVGAACAGNSSGDSSSSSSSGDNNGGSSSQGGGSSRASSSGTSGTSGQSSGTSGQSSGGTSGQSSGGTSGGSSGTSGTSGASGSTGILGGPCTPMDMASEDACAAQANGAQCLGLQGEQTGICGVPGCTANMTNCAGPGTKCQGTGTNTLCLTTCNPVMGDGQCGEGGACVNFAGGASCYPLAVADCDYNAEMTGCAMGQVCTPVGTDGFGQCQMGCDVFTQGCASGFACYADPMGEASCSQQVMMNGDGMTCQGPQQCATGLTCVATQMNATCRKYCDMAHPCDMGFMCAVLVQATGLGACIPM